MKDTPLILIFYFKRELLSNMEINRQMRMAIDVAIANTNIVAFLLPTDGAEKVDCINPVMLEKPDLERIDKLVSDISAQFDLQDEEEPNE